MQYAKFSHLDEVQLPNLAHDFALEYNFTST